MSEKKVSDIQARHDAAGDGRCMDLGEGWQAHEDRGVLLDEIREAHESARFANDDRMRAIRELGATRRCAHGADREISEASDALVALGIPEDGRTLAERIGALTRTMLPAHEARAIWEKRAGEEREKGRAEGRAERAAVVDPPAPLPPEYVPAAGCDGCGNDPGQRHGVDCQPLSLAWLGGTREATIAKLPADIAALVRADAPLTPSERAEMAERASPATRTFLAAVKAGGATVKDLETVLRAYAAEDRERKAWAAVAPPPEPDIEPASGDEPGSNCGVCGWCRDCQREANTP